MLELREKLAKWISSILEEYGLDSFYIATIIMVLISVMYLKEFKNWKTISKNRKELGIITILITIAFLLMSFLRLFNILE